MKAGITKLRGTGTGIAKESCSATHRCYTLLGQGEVQNRISMQKVAKYEGGISIQKNNELHKQNTYKECR
jgi:hypothetical protein